MRSWTGDTTALGVVVITAHVRTSTSSGATPRLPDAGHRQGEAVGPADEPGLVLVVPFVEPVGGQDAPTSGERRPERRTGRDRLGPGVDPLRGPEPGSVTNEGIRPQRSGRSRRTPSELSATAGTGSVGATFQRGRIDVVVDDLVHAELRRQDVGRCGRDIAAAHATSMAPGLPRRWAVRPVA